MTLVDTLRQMAGVTATQYTIGSDAYWTDEQLQQVLDRHVSTRLIQIPAKLARSLDESGQSVWVHGEVPRFAGTLDTENIAIVDRHGAALDGATVHPDGRIDFDTDQRNTGPLVSGLAYDLNAAAAEVLDHWSGALADGYDISIDGQSLKRSQRRQAIASRADTFRAKALPKTVRLVRRDLKGSR